MAQQPTSPISPISPVSPISPISSVGKRVPYDQNLCIGDTCAPSRVRVNPNKIICTPWDGESMKKFQESEPDFSVGRNSQSWNFVCNDTESKDNVDGELNVDTKIKKIADIGIRSGFSERLKLKDNQYMMVYSFQTDYIYHYGKDRELKLASDILTNIKNGTLSEKEFLDKHGTHVINSKHIPVEITLVMKYTSKNSIENSSGNINAKVDFISIPKLRQWLGLSGSGGIKKNEEEMKSEIKCEFISDMPGIDFGSENYVKLKKSFVKIADVNQLNGRGENKNINITAARSEIDEIAIKLIKDSFKTLKPKEFGIKSIQRIRCVNGAFRARLGGKINVGVKRKSSIGTSNKTGNNNSNNNNNKPIANNKISNVVGGKRATGERIYVVVAGDNLSKIVKKEYNVNSWTKTMKLYDANKDVIGKNMNDIKIGMKLKLPHDL